MNNNPHIKILILNYNGEEIIYKCLESVFNIDYDNYSVDVIDNEHVVVNLEKDYSNVILLNEKQ